MKKILIHLGMGGHTSQVLQLISSMGDKYAYSYLLGDDDKTSEKKIIFPGKIHRVKNPRLMSDRSLLIVLLKMIPASFQLFHVLRRVKPYAVISSGPSLAIPLFWLAKLLGIKTIFIESWVRVHHGSQAGRFCSSAADLFFVQWPSLKNVYPKAVYVGRLS